MSVNTKISIKASTLFVIILLFASISSVNADDNIDQCRSCHEEVELMPEDFSQDDVHLKANLTCAACHGGDSSIDDGDIAMSASKKFIGIPSKKNIPQICGKCHSSIDYMRNYQPRISTDQVDQYYKSVHGRQLIKGDDNVADCSSCHTAHNILSVKDPRSSVYPLNIPGTCDKCHGDEELMKEYNLKTDQFVEYSGSVHGVALLKHKDIGAPACNDCHGNHGATPPGFESVSHVCGMCHVNNEDYFKTSEMYNAFEEDDYHGCEQCHGYHSVPKPTEELLGAGENSICIDCHSEDEEGYLVGVKIKEDIVELSGLYNSAIDRMSEVKRIGMNDVEMGFILQDAKQRLIEARTLVHTFDIEQVNNKTTEGISLVNESLNIAEAETEEYNSRKMGFIYSLIGMFILFIAVYLKLKL